MQSSVIGSLSSLLLFATALCSFLFYGVVGQDKTWLLAPAFILSYAAITAALLRRAACQKTEDRGQRTDESGERREDGGPRAEGRGAPTVIRPQSSVPSLPSSGLLWILFIAYGIFLISKAAVPFEAKLVTLFVGGVVGAYLVWGSELTTFKDNRILLGALVCVVMLAALYGLIVHFKCPDQVLWAERYAVYEGRLMSTYICPNHFAHLMQMLMPFCLALLFIPQSGIYLKLLSAYSFLVFLPPLYLTESRAGWLGTITATGVVVCLMALRRSRRLFALLIVLVPLCSILLLLGGWKYSETFQRRMTPVVEFLQQQNEEGVGSDAKDFRPQTWMDTIDMIKEAPLFGFGAGNYRYTFPEHRKRFQGKRIVTGHPHNEYLELMADYGLVGFGLFALAWCFGLIRILIASMKAQETRHAFIGFAFIGAAAGTMVHSFFDFQMHVYPNALVFALLAALAWGPLATQRAKRTRDRGQRSEDGGQRTEDGDQPGESGIGYSALGSREENELSAAGSELFAENPATNPTRSADNFLQGNSAEGVVHYPPTTRLRRAGAWLLAIGYLLMAVLCLQIMFSAYIRAMGDRASESLDSSLTAERLYSLAAKIDPQNWRAYKGMGKLLFGNRYFSLEMDEKMMWAGKERDWYEKAYEQNPKDPEICLAYGKVLIFLGKNQGIRHLALGTGVDEETAAGRSDGGMASSPSTDIGDDVPPDSDLKAIRQQPLAVSRDGGMASSPSTDIGDDVPPDSDLKDICQQPLAIIEDQSADSASKTSNLRPQTANQLQTRGLELLREACRYRPFNDFYWWNLGVQLRRAGQYEEALVAFNRTASINRTASSKMNIEWLEARLKAADEGSEAVGDLPLQIESSKINTPGLTLEKPAAALDFDVSGAEADPGLMDLLDKMGE